MKNIFKIIILLCRLINCPTRFVPYEVLPEIVCHDYERGPIFLANTCKYPGSVFKEIPTLLQHKISEYAGCPRIFDYCKPCPSNENRLVLKLPETKILWSQAQDEETFYQILGLRIGNMVFKCRVMPDQTANKFLDLKIYNIAPLDGVDPFKHGRCIEIILLNTEYRTSTPKLVSIEIFGNSPLKESIPFLETFVRLYYGWQDIIGQYEDYDSLFGTKDFGPLLSKISTTFTNWLSESKISYPNLRIQTELIT